ncbi:MAG: hypothetical protein OEW90_21990 [Betaproteobacteria bacterium]|nr:hypothetical protein [Betaproteobacteria bacterium]
MARYKPVQRNGLFIPVVLDEQIQPGTFEFALPPRANMTCATYPREISEQRGRYVEQPTTQGPDARSEGFFRSGRIARSP